MQKLRNLSTFFTALYVTKKIHQIILYKFLVTILQTYNNNILSNNKKSLLSLSSFSSSLLYNSNNLVSELSNVSVPKPRVYISSYTKAKAPSKQSTQCESKICGSKESNLIE